MRHPSVPKGADVTGSGHGFCAGTWSRAQGRNVSEGSSNSPGPTGSAVI